MRRKKHNAATRLIFSAETLVCLLLAYPFRRWLNAHVLSEVRSIQLDLLFILLLIAAVFIFGGFVRRMIGFKSLFRDHQDL